MKETINIAFNWPKDISKAWSGTAYQIVKQFEKEYDVNLIDLTMNWIQKIVYRILFKFGFKGLATKLFLKWSSKKIIKYKKKGSIFQFCSHYIDESDKSYIYVDCTYRFLLNLYDNDSLAYKYSGFKYSKKELEMLANEQDNFFLNCSGIFVMGHHLKAFFDKVYTNDINKKVYYVGGGINLNKSEICLKQKENSFLFVGKDYYRKSCDLVIQAFEKISNNLSNVKLYVIGPSKFKSKNSNIVSLGSLSFQETQQYFNKTKVFIMPSRFEAYGLVFPEALVSGNIIIGVDKFEMSYFINDSNGYKTSYDVDDIAKKMTIAMVNDKLLNEIADNNTIYKDYYSWDSVFERMKEYIKRI